MESQAHDRTHVTCNRRLLAWYTSLLSRITAPGLAFQIVPACDCFSTSKTLHTHLHAPGGAPVLNSNHALLQVHATSTYLIVRSPLAIARLTAAALCACRANAHHSAHQSWPLFNCQILEPLNAWNEFMPCLQPSTQIVNAITGCIASRPTLNPF